MLYLVFEHTDYLVAHGFLACRAEMDIDLVCGIADSLYKVGLFSFCRCGRGFIGFHNISFPTHHAPVEK